MHPLALLPSLPPLLSAGDPTQSARAFTGTVITPFDAGLSAVDLAAIRTALRDEMDPNHLVGFASTLAADHPVSASLLYARSALIERRARTARDELAADGVHAADSLGQLIDRVTGRQWSGGQAVQWISAVPLDVGQNLAALVRTETGDRWADVGQGLLAVSPAACRWPRLDRLTAAADGAHVFATDPRCHTLREVSEAALALGQPVPLALRERFPLAASLQGFGFHELYPRTRGQNVFDRATDFAHAAILAHRLGTAPWVCLLLQRRAELDALVYGGALTTANAEREVRRAASDLVVDPRADLSGVPPEVALLAHSLVLEIGPDIRVVDPMAARIALRSLPLAADAPRSEDRQRWTTTYNRETNYATTA